MYVSSERKVYIMREELLRQCETYIENKDILRKSFRFESSYILPVCASVIASKGIVTSDEKLMMCKKAVEQQTGICSNFRGNVKLPMISMLATSDYPDNKMEQANKMYEKLKDEFFGSPYLALVSMILTDMISDAEADKIVSRGKAIYKRMKAEHPFLTSSEDSVFAVLMAFSDKSDDELVADMEACYKIVKNSVGGTSNAIQSLSHVLALTDGTSESKCDRVEKLYQLLKEKGKKFGRDYEISTLAAVAILPVDLEQLAQDIIDADEFLKNQKGYGFLAITKTVRLLHAAMLVANSYSNGNNTTTAALTGTIAMVAAQQAAMCTIFAAAAVSSASN